MNGPKVSIIVPVYKTEQYLKECIDSILSQTFTEFELILVDDCSPDNCPQICEEYAEHETRIKVIHNKTNQGLVKTRQAGLAHSTGDYIQFVDSDDWIEPNMMERLYQKASSEGCDIVYCDLIRFEGKKLTHSLPFDTRGRGKVDIVINMIEDNFPGFLCNKLFRRSLFINVTWPDYALREDVVTCIQLFLNAEKIGYEYSLLYRYRFNDNSISSNNKNRYKLINEVFENFRKIDNILKSRSDYDLYQTAITKMLKRYKTNDRFKLYYYVKRFFMAFVPYGFIVMYRNYACYSIKKFFSLFVPYGIIVAYTRLKAKCGINANAGKI